MSKEKADNPANTYIYIYIIATEEDCLRQLKRMAKITQCSLNWNCH